MEIYKTQNQRIQLQQSLGQQINVIFTKDANNTPMEQQESQSQQNQTNIRSSITVPYNIEPDRLQYDSKLYHVLSPYKKQINQQIEQINHQFEKRKSKISLTLSQTSHGSTGRQSLPNLYDSEVGNEFLSLTGSRKQSSNGESHKILPSSPLSFSLKTNQEDDSMKQSMRNQNLQSGSEELLPQLAQSLPISQSRHLVANKVKSMTYSRCRHVKSQLIPKSTQVQRPSWTPTNNTYNVFFQKQQRPAPERQAMHILKSQVITGNVIQQHKLTQPDIDPILLQPKKLKIQHKIPLLNSELGAYL